MTHQLTLSLLPLRLAVCQLAADEPIPAWATMGGFFSITRTADELSIICPQHLVPPTTQCNRDWVCLKVEGILDFSLTGILVALATPLANAGLSILAIATHDTDYLLVREAAVESAIAVLTAYGHTVRR